MTIGLDSFSPIYYDTRVFDKNGTQTKDIEYLLHLSAKISIGKFELNEYHKLAPYRL